MSMYEEDDETEDALMCEGMEDAAKASAKFLNSLRQSSEVEGDVTIVLSQTSPNQKETVREWPFDHRADIEDLVTEIVDAAVEDCMGLAGKRMKYTVIARDEDDAPIKGRATFTLKCPEREDEDDIDDIDDLPNRKGLMGMLMRHQQTIMKMTVGQTKSWGEYLMQTIREKDNRIKALESNQLQNLKAFEELISGRHVRDMELRRMEKAEQRKDQAVGMLVNALPMVAMKAMGANPADMPVPQASRTDELVEGLMATIGHEQLQELMTSKVFNTQQQEILMEIFREVLMKKQAREAAGASAAQQGPQNGAAHPQEAQETKSESGSSA